MQSVRRTSRQPRLRARVVKAFRRMANGLDSKQAYASSVRFYRSSGKEWAKQLQAG